MIFKMKMGFKFMQMEINMLDNLKMEKNVVMVNINIKIFILDYY